MDRSDFYQALAASPNAYVWDISGDNSITATVTRGQYKGLTFNPITAVANYLGIGLYGTNKRETIRAGAALGLPRCFTETLYNACTSVSNRGNMQVVRGRIRSALEV
jgi:hypothetical protein